MTHYLVQVNLPSTTGLPRDVTVNTFSLDAASQADAENGVEKITEFYAEIGEWISGAVTRTAPVNVKLYDMSDPEPREPVNEANVDILPAAASGGSLPLEVAVCISYKGADASGVNPKRNRGRIYIGPLITDASEMSGGYPRPANTFITTLVDAASTLGGDLIGVDAEWQVWSRADDTTRPIVRGWVDNEFDTQRRRGRDATGRNTFTFGG